MQHVTGFPRVRTVQGQYSIKQHDVRRERLHLIFLRLVGTAAGRDEQTEDQRRHRGDQAHDELHDILGPRVPVMLRQFGVQPHASEARAESTGKNDRGGAERVHGRVRCAPAG